jgi:hypothetical protein
MLRPWLRSLRNGMIPGLLCISAVSAPARAQDARIHGLWVWKGPSTLATAEDADKLKDFCQTQGVNEVYISVSSRGEMMPEARIAQTIAALHGSHIRVEALLSSEDADEPGKHREKLLSKVREILEFNRNHAKTRFDGIHLDIEPQQRPENKGPGNLRFFAGPDGSISGGEFFGNTGAVAGECRYSEQVAQRQS